MEQYFALVEEMSRAGTLVSVGGRLRYHLSADLDVLPAELDAALQTPGFQAYLDSASRQIERPLGLDEPPSAVLDFGPEGGFVRFPLVELAPDEPCPLCLERRWVWAGDAWRCECQGPLRLLAPEPEITYHVPASAQAEGALTTGVVVEVLRFRGWSAALPVAASGRLADGDRPFAARLVRRPGHHGAGPGEPSDYFLAGADVPDDRRDAVLKSMHRMAVELTA